MGRSLEDTTPRGDRGANRPDYLSDYLYGDVTCLAGSVQSNLSRAMHGLPCQD